MPGMDGTGPRFAGTRKNPGRRMCRNMDGQRNGLGRGMGTCRFAGMSEREALTKEKEALQDRLSQIEKRLQEL